jgi:hypothetical protein
MTSPDTRSENSSRPANQFEIDLDKPEKAVVWHPQFAIAGLTLVTAVVSAGVGIAGYNLGYQLVPEVSAAVGGGALVVGQIAELVARKKYGEPRV